jgi:hypothetical protein
MDERYAEHFCQPCLQVPHGQHHERTQADTRFDYQRISVDPDVDFRPAVLLHRNQPEALCGWNRDVGGAV